MAAHQLDAPLDTSRAAVARPWLVCLATAGLTFWLAYENGSYDLSMRYALGVGVWWAVVVASVTRLARSNQAAAVTAGALAAFALWTLASTAWASNAEAAFSEFSRVSLYTGVFVLCSLLARRRDLPSWCDGIGFGIAAVAALSFASRAFPDTIGSKAGTTILPALENRLSYPVGYWNGLGFLCALGTPLLLATTTGARPRALRCVAAGTIPLLAAVVYMTSSRGAVAAVLTGVAVFASLTPHRWRALLAILLTGMAAAIAVAIVERHPSFANGTGASAAVRHSVTLSMLAVVLVTAGAFAALSFVREPERRPPAAVVIAVAAVVALVVVVAAIAAHPVRRYEAFKAPPAALATAHGNAVTEHLLSASGSGRWQLWQAAVDEFRTNRVHGRGAGSYADWWAAHGSLAVTVQNAHSLYLETVGELGVVGLALLALPFLVAVSAVATRLPRLEPAERLSVAAAAAVVCAFLVACAVDWMWQLPAISIVAFAALAIAVVGAAGDQIPARSPNAAAWGAAIAVVIGLVAAGAQGWPLLTQLQIGASQHAARRGNTSAAIDSASSAVDIQPWAASPRLQLALVEEQAGRLRAAGAAIDKAVARAPDDWHLWLVAARIQAKRGELASARRSLRRARSLNPRSPLFARG
jgi:hypothetical protein